MPDDAEAAVEDATDADPADADADAAETPPDIPDTQQADLPDGLDPAAAEAAAGAGGDTDQDPPDDSETDEPSTDATGDTYGDLYARTLVNVTNAAIEEYGDADADQTDLEAARQLNIPDHADRLVEELGLGSDMPPGQALVASSAVFVLVNLSAKTDLPAELMGDFDI